MVDFCGVTDYNKTLKTPKAIPRKAVATKTIAVKSVGYSLLGLIPINLPTIASCIGERTKTPINIPTQPYLSMSFCPLPSLLSIQTLIPFLHSINLSIAKTATNIARKFKIMAVGKTSKGSYPIATPYTIPIPHSNVTDNTMKANSSYNYASIS